MPTLSTFSRALPWHRTRVWHRFLQDLLLVRGRRRYALSISPHNPLGATDPHARRVLINPFDLADPGDPARSAIRSVPAPHADMWQQALATALVEHEASHIWHSGAKPTASLLGWVWNSLEDERIERQQIAAHPALAHTFDFLGDAILVAQRPTTDLLAGCLLWRWEWDRAPDERCFQPTDNQRVLWDGQIRPRVEAAWQAPTSDDVVTLAHQILDLLNMSDDASLPDDLPRQSCRCGPGHTPQTGSDPPDLPDVPHVPGGVMLPGHPPARSTPDAPPEADPTPILAHIEGYARSLAASLRPSLPLTHAVPHPSRGAFVLERAMVRAPRPFDHQQAPAPARDMALKGFH